MAGYVIGIGGNSEYEALENMQRCIKNGVYSTNINVPNTIWNQAHEGTFTDYLSMKAGDKIFFFHKRKIYGIGELVNINGDCKYWNYLGAEKPINREIKQPIIDYYNEQNRCVCFFKPSPAFYKKAVDMDDALLSNPSAFKMLRAFWKLSFIKIDDEECNALLQIIVKRNKLCLNEKFDYNTNTLTHIKERITEKHRMNTNMWLDLCDGTDGSIKHEMTIEANIVECLTNKRHTEIFGEWDYISHQVVASPFKPIDYMYKMDIFAYHFLKVGDYLIQDKYLIIEVKKDSAKLDVLHQIMKYVDWVTQEYAHGDFSMIEACIVAKSFSREIIEEAKEICVRNYSVEYNPSIAAIWNNIKFITYKYCGGKIVYDIVN